MRKDEQEMHRVVEIHPDPAVGGWQVGSLRRTRPTRFFPTKASAEAYLVAAGAKYIPDTDKWEGGSFDD